MIYAIVVANRFIARLHNRTDAIYLIGRFAAIGTIATMMEIHA